MSVSLISNKKPRMTIEDLAMEMREGFKKVNARLDAHDEIFKRNNLK